VVDQGNLGADDGVGLTDAVERTRIEAMRAQIEDVRGRVDAATDHVPAVESAKAVFGHDRLVAGKVLSAAIAYRLFLWILPLALTLAGVLGFLRDRRPTQPSDVAGDLGLSAYVASSVADAASQAEKGRYLLLLIGLVGLWTASTAGAKTVIVVHSLVWGEPLPSVKGPRAALGFLGFAVAAISITIGVRFAGSGVGRSGLAEVVVLGSLGALWLAVSQYLPHGAATWRQLVPGAIVVGAGVALIHFLTSVYLIHRIAKSSELYGGLGAAAAILLWLYFVGRLLVLSAVVNAALARRATRHG
jgi:uncharacterized BrkB/YihY/UPF0761 family membrane protein